jgi:hypothetical protein
MTTRILMLQAIVTALLFAAPASAQHGWPVEPVNAEHPIGNSFGEFQNFGGVYQHTGIDILVAPRLDAAGLVDASAPWIVATVGGTVNSLSDVVGTMYNGTVLAGTDGVTYRYWHLQNGSYDANYVLAFNNGTAVAAGDHIAQIVRWVCDFHHLHYDLQNATSFLNPLADITPNPDPLAPEIASIGLGQPGTNPWTQFAVAAPGACTVVSGDVDVVPQLRDRDDASSTLAGADTVGTYDTRWRACPDGTPSCPWIATRRLDDMPLAWGTAGNAGSTAQFSITSPWVSDSNYCAATWAYPVVSHWAGGAPSATTHWATAGLPNGAYSVSVEATDFAGNVSVRNVHTCVQNGPGCTTDLTIRDGTDDAGAVPYGGWPFWLSPDITANAGTPDENYNIRLGAANAIDVRVWNTGSCTLPAGATYQVCAGWDQPSGSVPYPLPAGHQIGCQTQTVPAGGWAPGTSLVTSFIWTPDATVVPQGHHCLVAWADSSTDPVRNTSSVVLDGNRAQRNIAFQAPPSPGAPGFADFWVNPLEGVRDRVLELRFKFSGPRPNLRSARLHIPPGLEVRGVSGAEVVGGYRGDRPEVACKESKESPCGGRCGSLQDAHQRGCTVILGGIGPWSRVRLEGLKLTRRTRLQLEVWTESKSGHGEFIDADIVELGTWGEQKQLEHIGGVTLRFEHRRR